MSKNEMDNQRNASRKKSVGQKLMEYRMKIFSAVAIVVIVCAVIIFVCYRSYMNQVYTGYEIISSVEQKHIDNSRVLGFGTGFLSYTADGIHCTDEKGNDIWSCPFEMQNPMVHVRDHYVAVADYNGRTIYMFDSTGEIGTIQTSNPIRDIEISDNGMVAAVLDNGDITSIKVFYYDGSEMVSFRTTMAKSGYPVALAMSNDGKLLSVSYLYLDNGILTSKVAFYNFGEVGQNETDNLVSAYEYQNEIVPFVGFLNNSTAFAVANDKLVIYEGTQRPTNKVSSFLKAEVESVYYGSDHIGIVYVNPTAESKYIMDVYDERGNVVNSFPINMEYEEIFFHEEYVVIYNAASCVIYHMNGTLKYQGDFEESVRLMLPTSSPLRYVLVLQDKIETIILK